MGSVHSTSSAGTVSRDDVVELPLGLVLRVRLEDACVRLHHLAERPEADALAVRERATLTPVDELGVPLDRLEELVDEPALADARLPDEGHELCGAPASHALERIEQRVELAAAPDERRPHPARDVDTDAAARLDRLPHVDRIGLALRLHGLRLAVVDRVVGRAPCRLADEDAVDRRVRLEPRSGVDDVARDHALAFLRPRAERDECLARVDADTELELCLLVEDPVADRERRADSAFGVVLVRDRGAEDRHHRVADELLDGAAEALELVPEPRVVRAKQRAHLLGIHLLGARGEADEIGEEDRHDLALLEPCLLGRLERRPARVAEACSLRVLLAAARAGDHGRKPTPTGCSAEKRSERGLRCGAGPFPRSDRARRRARSASPRRSPRR